LDHLRRWFQDPYYASLCGKADLVVADGMPIIWLSHLNKTPLPSLVAGSNLILDLSKRSALDNRSIFFLGGEPGTAEATSKVLQKNFPSLIVAGIYCPKLDFENDEKEMAKIISMLQTIKPNIIYVALGSPKQEALIEKLKKLLPGAWWLGVGISFSYISGKIRRAPTWMQKVGLEWFYRTIQEPKRLVRRYFIQDLPFALNLFSKVLINRFINKSF
jgi:N-acetylglucosaminyldiphosphoundecaprenol N-acetyl-beta-D-mannosaminyltransferase